MRHAATLKQTGLDRVEDAARLVGYENPFNFSTAFKRAHGISPKQYQYASSSEFV
jgi:AraC-like DNA-binding protein